MVTGFPSAIPPAAVLLVLLGRLTIAATPDKSRPRTRPTQDARAPLRHDGPSPSPTPARVAPTDRSAAPRRLAATIHVPPRVGRAEVA